MNKSHIPCTRTLLLRPIGKAILLILSHVHCLISGRRNFLARPIDFSHTCLQSFQLFSTNTRKKYRYNFSWPWRSKCMNVNGSVFTNFYCKIVAMIRHALSDAYAWTLLRLWRNDEPQIVDGITIKIEVWNWCRCLPWVARARWFRRRRRCWYAGRHRQLNPETKQ